MPLCVSIPATVDTDTNTRGLYLSDLEVCMKNFSEAITSTMNSYRSLLTAFDQVAQVYGNISQHCGNEARKQITEFRDGMRDLKDKGGFDTFNNEIHRGTIAVMGSVNADLKKADKSYSVLKSKRKEYDAIRFKLDMIEKSYAKKNKPLTLSNEYKKTVLRRDKAKASYESHRETFGNEIKALQASTKDILLQSLNNYLHCTATFCGQLETTMSSYRTDVDNNGTTRFTNTNMDALKEKAMAESFERRSRRIDEAPLLYTATGNALSNGDHLAGEDNLCPKEDKEDHGDMSENSNANSAGSHNPDSANPFLGVRYE
ncbi:hypothetical protein JKF63_03352 [Porcisia hertigi]|uniref:Uncharacterized protein n=1 Tax=Porcisia hertigi TaxID=2761500 RepID=A0A836IS34_9TRYP|nr:hypothetical protein JKF63_03352 [Porcisia hertigi]